jgi:hypothetical protein
MAGVSAKLPGGLALMSRTMLLRPLRQLPIAFGWMSKRGIPDDVAKRWLRPLRNPEIRRDVRKYAADTKHGMS